jgi:hypothetical protein
MPVMVPCRWQLSPRWTFFFFSLIRYCLTYTHPCSSHQHPSLSFSFHKASIILHLQRPYGVAWRDSELLQVRRSLSRHLSEHQSHIRCSMAPFASRSCAVCLTCPWWAVASPFSGPIIILSSISCVMTSLPRGNDFTTCSFELQYRP